MLAEERINFIKNTLTEKLTPTFLDIIDDGHKHIGHVGNKGGGHFTVAIASPLFENRSTLECHQLVYNALGPVVGTEIHALSIKVKR